MSARSLVWRARQWRNILVSGRHSCLRWERFLLVPWCSCWDAKNIVSPGSIDRVLVMIAKYKQADRRKPEASFRAKLLSALACAIKGGFRLDAARPAAQLEKHGRAVAWDEQFIDDLRQALQVCKVW